MLAIDRVILANMRNFSRRRDGGGAWRFFKSLGGVLVLLVITVIAVRAAWGMYGKFAGAAQSDALAQKELTVLQLQQAQMAASVDSFATPRGMEAQVRERYGVVKPGEGQIQIVRDSASTTTQTAPPQNLFIRAWQALFGWL